MSDCVNISGEVVLEQSITGEIVKDAAKKNHSKSVRYKENTTDIITPDEGYDGLSQVEVIVDVGGEEPVPDDGKTRLYLDIPDGFRKDVPLYWSQTVSDGVLIDKGDGSEPFTLSGKGNRNTTLSYAAHGKYCITMDVVAGEVWFGGDTTRTVIGGNVQNNASGRANMGYAVMLYKVETGDGVTSIGYNAFYNCYALQSINILDGVTGIAFNAFYACTFMKEYIFLPTIPPTLANINAFTEIPTDCQIFVPDESLEAYKTATNWTTQAGKIYPISERVTT